MNILCVRVLEVASLTVTCINTCTCMYRYHQTTYIGRASCINVSSTGDGGEPQSLCTTISIALKQFHSCACVHMQSSYTWFSTVQVSVMVCCIYIHMV